MKTLNIGGKDYIFEFTMEASLYDECAISITSFMNELNEGETKSDMKRIIASMANIPQTALTVFYAGLLEHHGKDGDKSILGKSDAKKLIKTYFNEHKEDEKGNFYGVLNLMIEIMMDDGFFEQIGLTQALTMDTEKTTKKPQDHKKKAAKPTEK